jgi:hypothetical protein
MLFQNIVLEAALWSNGMGTTSPNRGCTPPHTTIPATLPATILGEHKLDKKTSQQREMRFKEHVLYFTGMGSTRTLTTLYKM